MLPFIRIIRKSLIESGDVRKYILYAIGEITLVVIGIMIALAANASLEQRRENRQALAVLQSLNVDIHNDLRQLDDYWLPQNERINEGRQRLKDFLSTDLPIQDSIQFVSDVIWVALYATYDPNTTTIDELISSGGLGRIRNAELKTTILNYYNQIENISEFDLIHRAYFVELYGRLGPKIIGGFVLTESFMALAKEETNPLISFPDKSLDAEYIRSTDYLRVLLEATGAPFILKQGGYNSLRRKSIEVIRLIDEELNYPK